MKTWMDNARKVGNYTYKCPVTKRHKNRSFSDTGEIVTTDNASSRIEKFNDMENPDKWTRTSPLLNKFSTKVDDFRDTTVTEIHIEDVNGYRKKRTKNY